MTPKWLVIIGFARCGKPQYITYLIIYNIYHVSWLQVWRVYIAYFYLFLVMQGAVEVPLLHIWVLKLFPNESMSREFGNLSREFDHGHGWLLTIPYCGWLQSPAPVDRWFIPLFLGFQHVFTHPSWCRISQPSTECTLVGGLEHGFYDFPYVGNGKITPTDFHSIIFQRGRSTTNQYFTDEKMDGNVAG